MMWFIHCDGWCGVFTVTFPNDPLLEVGAESCCMNYRSADEHWYGCDGMGTLSHSSMDCCVWGQVT